MKKHLLLPLTVLALSSAAASDQPHGTWADAKVTNVAVYTTGGSASKGYVVVTFAANSTGTPGCASGYPRNIAIDTSTASAMLAFETLERSTMMGAPVTVTGTGTCSVIPNTETLASVQSQAMR
jgi:hypothetical protein